MSAAGFKGLAERVDAAEERVVAAEERAEEKNAAQDAEIGTIVTAVSKLREELKTGRAPSGERGDQLARELVAAKATLATQQAQISQLSATLAQLLATPQAHPMPVDAINAAKPTASRRLEEAGSSPPQCDTTYTTGLSATAACTQSEVDPYYGNGVLDCSVLIDGDTVWPSG